MQNASEGQKESGESASLSIAEFQEMVRASPYAIKEKRVHILGFSSKEILCSWDLESEFKDNKRPERLRVELSAEDGHIIAEMEFHVGEIENVGRVWYLTHRQVPNSQRGNKLGPYALHTAEKFLKQLCAHDERSPKKLYISSSRPSVIRFAEREGYHFASKTDEEMFDTYMQEYRAFGKSVEYQRTRELPSFIEVRVRNAYGEDPDRDPVLIDKAALAQFEHDQKHAAIGPILKRDTQSAAFARRDGKPVPDFKIITVNSRRNMAPPFH